MEADRARRIEPELSPQARAANPAFRDFVASLQMLEPQFDHLVQNFAWCAGQIAGEPNAPAQLRAMMEFARKYHQFGLDRAVESIEDNSGIPTDIAIPTVEITPDRRIRTKLNHISPTTPGIIVGLIGARYRTPSADPTFEAVAVIHDEKGREEFVGINISPDGITSLNLEYVVNQYPRSIEELYPPSQKGKSPKRKK